MTRPLDQIDNALVKRAASGETAALDRILTAAMRPIYNLALRMLQNHADAEDATQEVLIRIATRLSGFRGEARFSTWAWTIATRSILDFRDGRAKRAMLSVEGFAADLSEGLDMAAAHDPELSLFVSQVKLGCCRAMLQILDGNHRLAYILGEILELDQTEAAAALGISHATFRKRLSRARSRLQSVLCKNCGIADATNPCRCSRRIKPATALGRLEPRDAVALDMPALSEKVRALDKLSQVAAVFQADPDTSAANQILPRVKAVFAAG